MVVDQRHGADDDAVGALRRFLDERVTDEGAKCLGPVGVTAQGELDERKIPMMGVMGAFVFAAQMINFPVGLGTSAHLVGGALLAMTLGPPTAVVVMTAILAIQALVFQDGGLLA